MLKTKKIILRRILPVLLILALVPSLMAVPAAAVDVTDDASDGHYNYLVSDWYNFYRNGELYLSDLVYPNYYCSEKSQILAYEWGFGAAVNHFDAVYFTLYCYTKPDKVEFKPYGGRALEAEYIGGSAPCYQYRVNSPHDIATITVRAYWDDGYLGHFGIWSCTGVLKNLSLSVSTVALSGREMISTSDFYTQYRSIVDDQSLSLPYPSIYDSVAAGDYALEADYYITISPDRSPYDYVDYFEFNISTWGDSEFSAAIVDSNNMPVQAIETVTIVSYWQSVLIDNGNEWPICFYTVRVNLDGFDLTSKYFQLHVGTQPYKSESGVSSYLFSIESIICKQYIEELPWYRTFFRWINKSISKVGTNIVEAVTGGAVAEQQQASQQGQSSTSQLENAVPDYSDGFVDSVTGLAASMSYDGTAAVLSSGPVVFPQIGNLVPSFTIVDNVEVDFETYINMMPAPVLLLVRSLFTIALIVYCFKELYSTIAYILTLKGGGD